MSATKGRALWLPDVLRDAGLKVEVVPGWETRGKEPAEWLCQVLHHTAGPRRGTHPSLGTVTNGRGGSSPVPGPLCNALPARDGVWHVIASGAANHPGVSSIPYRGGIHQDVKYYALGWEAENDGVGEPWAQLEAIEIGEAAVADYLGWRVDTSEIWGHKEIARPLGRKIDPAGIDMDEHRAAVARRRTHHQEDIDMTADDLSKLIDAKLAPLAKDLAEVKRQLVVSDEGKGKTQRTVRHIVAADLRKP